LFGQQAEKRDWLKPLLGAFVCGLLFYVIFSITSAIIAFFGRVLVGVTLATLLSAALASAAAMAIFESRKLTDLGLAFREGTRRNLIIGIALGVGSAVAVMLIPIAVGAAHFQWIKDADISILGDLFMPILLFCGAMGEEIVFRGFIMQYLARGWGNWPGVIAAAIFFGLLHTGNPGATWLGALNTTLFGIVFGVAVLRTHELWLPIGIHFGWNVTFPFLGATLSGLTIRVTGYEWKWNTGNVSHDYWSGGAYGPEASLLCTAIIAVLLLIMWKIPVYKGWAWLLDTKTDAEPAQSGVELPPVS
jgi:hypothetical protein